MALQRVGDRARLTAALAAVVTALGAVAAPARAVEPAPAAPVAPLLVATARESADAGATAAPSYPVPGDAVVVSPGGSDDATGTVDAPFRTVARAVEAAPPGGTVVLRAGSYTESVEVPEGKSLVIQNWPGEVVWLDGSRQLGGWAPERGDWRLDTWTSEFDRSPTYTRGAPDGSQPGWRWIDPDHPAAAWPEQVWVDGRAQLQVTSRDQVRPGRFYVDGSADRLYLGTDPTGHTVRGSVLAKALTIRAADATVRGIGVHRYATSVPLMGSVTVEAPRVLLEHVRVVDNATTGIFTDRPDTVLRHVTAEGNGLAGVIASTADHLRVEQAAFLGNNTERFNESPVSGGIKVGRSRDVLIRDSRVSGNDGPGVWIDESTFDSRVVGNDVVANSGHGVVVEISAKALLADNLIRDNGADGHAGIKINNTSDVRIWNNSVLGGTDTLAVVQDRRTHHPGTAGIDPRSPGDPAMTWLNGPVEIRNNVLGGASRCVLCVEDHTGSRSAADFGVSADGDAYPGAYGGASFAVWAVGQGHPLSFASLSEWRDATGMETSGWAAPDEGGPVPVAMPADVAALVGVPVGTQQVGTVP